MPQLLNRYLQKHDTQKVLHQMYSNASTLLYVLKVEALEYIWCNTFWVTVSMDERDQGAHRRVRVKADRSDQRTHRRVRVRAEKSTEGVLQGEGGETLDLRLRPLGLLWGRHQDNVFHKNK